MRLIEDWKLVLKHAWSIKLVLVAGLLSGLEALLVILNGLDFLPFWLRILTAVATPLVVAAAFVARIVAQPRSMKKEVTNESL